MSYLPLLEQVPREWTARQWVSCQRVCQQQNVPFRPHEWDFGLNDTYIMNKMPINGMFIGIERDGFAHT